MKGAKVVFILGAGASVDSGMKTYRGGNDMYYNFDEGDPFTNPIHVSALGDDKRMAIMWDHFDAIQKDIDKITELGNTYIGIQRIIDASEETLILNQNIDGLASRLTGSCEIVELHGNLRKSRCDVCGNTRNTVTSTAMHTHKCVCNKWMRPDVLLFGETMSPQKSQYINTRLKRERFDTCYVVGTSLRFPYLRNMINTLKGYGTEIIHVNTDPNYTKHTHTPKEKGSYESRHTYLKKKKNPERLVTYLCELKHWDTFNDREIRNSGAGNELCDDNICPRKGLEIYTLGKTKYTTGPFLCDLCKEIHFMKKRPQHGYKMLEGDLSLPPIDVFESFLGSPVKDSDSYPHVITDAMRVLSQEEIRETIFGPAVKEDNDNNK